MIAADIAKNRLSQLPPQIRSGAFLTVERRWVVEDLPDHELLEALSHCYGVLSQVVAEAHERANARFVVCDANTGEVNIPTKHLGGKLPCMVLDRDHRTVLVSLASVSCDSIQRIRQVDPDEGDKVAKRYGLTRKSKEHQESRGETTPDDLARTLLHAAQKMLAKDKRLLSMAWVRRADGQWMPHALQPPEDDADKAILMYLLARHVERDGATAVVHIGEVWIGTRESAAKGIRPTDAPDRSEGILATILVEGEPPRALAVRFSRSLFGKITFGEVDEIRNPRRTWVCRTDSESLAPAEKARRRPTWRPARQCSSRRFHIIVKSLAGGAES